jgi:hypothetical protein
MSNAVQVKAIYTLLGKLHLRDEKESIVLAFSGGKTDSVRELSFGEAAALIAHLKSMDDPEENSNTRMRNKIIGMAREMNWLIKGTGKVDMDHLNNWCVQLGYLHKKLDDYTHSELPGLVTQFEQVYKSYLKGV